MTMGIDTRGVQGQPPVDPTATPIDTERRRERQDHRTKKKAAPPPIPPAPADDDAITIAPEGAKIDVRA
jgi:hypothetical protein